MRMNNEDAKTVCGYARGNRVSIFIIASHEFTYQKRGHEIELNGLKESWSAL
jgi:hypothetical protein